MRDTAWLSGTALRWQGGGMTGSRGNGSRGAGSRGTGPEEGHCYRVVLEGELDERFASTFATMTISRVDGNTVLEGIIIDQAQLHGLINRLSLLGLTLLSVTSVSVGN